MDTEQHGLDAGPPESQLLRLKQLKNELIGHEHNKRIRLESGITHDLITQLAYGATHAIRVEAAICLSSLAHGDDEVQRYFLKDSRAILEAVISCVVQIDADSQLLLPSMRILLCACRRSNELCPMSDSLVSTINKFIMNACAPKRVSNASDQAQLTILSCQLVEATCDDHFTHRTFERSGIPQSLTELISHFHVDMSLYQGMNSSLSSLSSQLVCSALAALNKIVKGRSDLCERLCTFEYYEKGQQPINFLAILFRLVRSSVPALRLEAVSVLISIFRCDLLSEETAWKLRYYALPCLVGLLNDSSGRVLEKTPSQLGFLITISEEMQQSAAEAGVIKTLGTIISRVMESQESNMAIDVPEHDLLHSCLLCVASITLFRDDCRKKVIEARIVPQIVNAMASPSKAIRAAACQCARSMTRSVCLLRTNLMGSGFPKALFRLLADEDLEVKTVACAAVCNLVLEFSQIRDSFRDKRVLGTLCKLALDPEPTLRLNALWAIKHLAFACDRSMKQEILDTLGSSNLVQLCNDPELGVEEQALDVIRNMLCGKGENVATLINTIGSNEVFAILNDKLSSRVSEIVIPAVYIIVHIAGGPELFRTILLQQSDLVVKLISNLSHSHPEVRLGCVWVAINLTWVNEPTPDGVPRQSHAELLKQFGFDQKLAALVQDPSIDIRERVKTALAQINNFSK